MIRDLVLSTLVALAVSCQGTDDRPGEGSEPAAPLLGTEWTLASMDFEGGFLVMSSPRQHPTLLVEEAQEEGGQRAARGFAGVNRFHGSCSLDDTGSLSFGPLATTRMAGDPELMRLEAAYLEHLAGATSYELSSTGLVVLTGTGKLVFKAPGTP